jgi:hypothetical protein
MPGNNADIEEPLLYDTQLGDNSNEQSQDAGVVNSGRNNQPIIICDGGEPVRGDVRLNQATATLAATIIGEFT